MKIRLLKDEDIPVLEELNKINHPNDSFPNFDKFEVIYVITTNSNEIITAGGIELIVEGVCITDKKFSEHVRGRALRELLSLLLQDCSRIDQAYLHVFLNSHDEVWERALQGNGFKLLKGAFYIGVNDGYI